MQLNDIAGQVQIVSNWSEIVSKTAVQFTSQNYLSFLQVNLWFYPKDMLSYWDVSMIGYSQNVSVWQKTNQLQWELF